MTQKSVSNEPFWFISKLSFTVVCGVSLFVLYSLLQTFAWQYTIILTALLTLGLLHIFAWWRVHKRGRHHREIWLLAFGQITLAVIAPLFIKDFLIISPFLLLVVPLEISTVDHLRKVPIALVFTMLGATGMMICELLAMPGRLTFLQDQNSARLFIVIAMSIHLAVHIYFLWYYRLRLDSPFVSRLNLAGQQALTTIAITAFSIISVTAVLAIQIRENRITEIGLDQQRLAEMIGQYTGNNLETQLQALYRLTIENVTQETIEAANNSYPDDPMLCGSLMRDYDRRWKSDPDGSPFILKFRDNPMVMELVEFRKIELANNNMFITDKLGGLVACQGKKAENFNFYNEPWWQATWSQGLGNKYLGKLKINPATKIPSLFMATPIYSTKNGQFIGVLATEFELRWLQNIYSSQTNESGSLHLINHEGMVIASSIKREEIGSKLWHTIIDSLPKDNFASMSSSWLLGENYLSQDSVISHAPLSTFSNINKDALHKLKWRVVRSVNREESLAIVVHSVKITVLVGIIALMFGVIGAASMGHIIGRPLENLTLTASAITKGNFAQRADPKGPEEMVTLANAFNSLTVQLQDMISDLQEYNQTLEDRVRERTEKLRRTQKSLIDGAHYSGMAEIASGILHNVGNLFNSINISIQTSEGIIKNSKIDKLKKLNELLHQNKDNLAEFLSGQRGSLLLEYIHEVSESLALENKTMSTEFISIQDNVTIIRESLAAQRKYAQVINYQESVNISDLVSDLLMAEEDVLKGHHVEVITRLAELPDVKAIRTKLSYAVLALVDNAREAMLENPIEERFLKISTYLEGHEVFIKVEDTGKGIPEGMHSAIFQYGYTTKTDGNGFGLHTCANTMKEMEGNVWAETAPDGSGSIFTLSLPMETSASPEPETPLAMV